ncbi:MAG TPA: phosphoadenosine phosphosulfate reductase family protein [Anaerolineae bacterium]|nr:phosphoadenosine phosphosulfate reductase family protein [Anaerolineae bacterium]
MPIDSRRALLLRKLEDSKQVVLTALELHGSENLSIAWTGGKDSTLVVYIARLACAEAGAAVPACFLIDEGDVFPMVRAFVDRLAAAWDLRVSVLHNHDVSRAASGQLGSEVHVAALDERNRAEIERLGYEEDTFVYEPESFVGNHLMKTAVLNRYLYASGITGFLAGIRWDEQGARADETHFSPRSETPYNPAHTRVSPILHYTERDVWDTIHWRGIPYCSLYSQGYRSLGARVTTVRVSDQPAWEQDLENTDERGGRRQDKEDLMRKFRDLGYM